MEAQISKRKGARAMSALAVAGAVWLPCCLNGEGAVTDAGGSSAISGQPACEQVAVLDFFPETARASPGSIVSLRARVEPPDNGPCTAPLVLSITHSGELLHEEERSIPLEPGVPQSVVFRWLAPPDDFRGYLAVVSASGGSERSTGVDVSSTPLRYPRYGYISIFPPEQTAADSRDIVSRLAQEYHLNMFQLYDWFYRSEDLIPRVEGEIAPTWVDLFGRTNAWSTITNVVQAVHDENAHAMGYVAIYAAREGYEQLSAVSPAWGLYEDPAAAAQANVAFGGERRLFLFDPSNVSWQQWMAREYVESVNEANFDGVHLDQFGPRPTLYRADGTSVELNQTFAPFLEAVDRALEANDPARDACAFNLVDGAVGGYAVEEVATTSACDLLYSELWFSTDTYSDLTRYIEHLRAIGGGRAVVLAMYAQYGEDVGRMLEAEEAMLTGVAVDTDHPGFSGEGFVDSFDEVGDSIAWTVNQAEDAWVSYVLRYASATGAPATRTLEVDGVPVGKLRFGARDSWQEWAFDAWLQERLTAGEHTVSVVFAPDDVGVINIDRMSLGEFDEASLRLQNAVVFASGATPIQLGDDVQSLAHEYFPNRSKSLTPALQRALRSQYSFITAHEHLLFAPEVRPVPGALERVVATSPGHTLISAGAGGIYALLRSAQGRDLLHLVNLNGVDNARWRDAAPVPEPQENVRLRYQIPEGRTVSAVMWATPDAGSGAFRPLEFTVNDGFLTFQLARLAYWDVILIRYD